MDPEEVEVAVGGGAHDRKYSVASSGAIATLEEYERQVEEMELAVQTDVHAMIGSEDLAGVISFKQSMEQLVGRAEKLQYNQVDTITTGGLTSGKDEARSKRKELNKRINSVVAAAKDKHLVAKEYMQGREAAVAQLNAEREAEARKKSFEARGSVKAGNSSFDDGTWLGRWKNPGIREAVHISYASIAITILCLIVGLIVGIKNNSSAMLASALESGVDVVSSILVLWRFWGKEGDEGKLATREKRASVSIAMTFIVISLIVGITSIAHLAKMQVPENTGALSGISVPTMIILGILGFEKLYIAKRLGSFAMKKDGVCSIAAAGLSLGITVGAVLFNATDNNVWRFDAIFALLISILLGAYGTRTLLKNEWYTKAFWSDARWQADFNGRDPSMMPL